VQHKRLYCNKTTGDDDEDPILEATDKALATFSSKRQLLIDLGKDAFLEHTILRDGRVYVTVETITGETPALTKQDKGNSRQSQAGTPSLIVSNTAGN
jgi:hypothetical protein